MSTNTGPPGYDANLLAAAPVPPKDQPQNTYNLDLLAEKTTLPSARPDLEAHGSSPPEHVHYEQPIPISPKVPFYRTRKGIITIVVVLAVIIAASVGGGVAASKKKPASGHTAAGPAALTKPVNTGVASPTIVVTLPMTIYPGPTLFTSSPLITAGI